MDNNKDNDLKKASQEEAESVMANTNVKIAMSVPGEEADSPLASQNVKTTMKLEDPEGTMSAFTGQADGEPKGDKDPEGKKPKGKKKMNIFLYFILSIVTVGLWPRFRPRKGGWKGSWMTTIILLLIANATLVGERFFKEDVNALGRQQLQLEVDVFPDVIPFDTDDGALVALKGDVESLTSELTLERSKNAKLKAENEDLQKANGDLAKSLQASGDAVMVQVEEKVVEKIVEKEVFVEVAPVIEHSNFTESDAQVGCQSPYSSERSADVFEQKFKGKWVNWTGIVEKTNNESVLIHELNNPSSKALVKFDKEGAGYYMLKGKEVSMTFKLEEQGTCETPFVGTKGVEQKEPESKA